MNILIIGNGFDLAHGLPTTYKDFLDFANAFEDYTDRTGQIYCPTENGKKFMPYFVMISNNKIDIYSELRSLIKNNTWFKYFNQIYEERRKNGKTGWIDFESEISELIQILESNRTKLIEKDKLEQETIFLNEYQTSKLRCFYTEQFGLISLDLCKKIKCIMMADLNKLIRALEIYLSDYINNLPVEKRLPDIEGLKIDKVLSFNYTNTYERLYGKDNSDIEYDYIHGKADINHNINSCNMVLGIDEYLPEGEKDENTEFIQFKKFYQRIYKKTGCKYLDWINGYLSRLNDTRRNKFNTVIEDFNIYIFGHSLDITDKDILWKLILTKYARTTIFHLNQKALGNQITNLVKVIGQDNLISMVHGKHARIILQQQQDAKNIEVEKKEE